MKNRWLIIGLIALTLLSVGFLIMGREETEERALLVRPEAGPFRVEVVSTGELRAKNSVDIMGPGRVRRAGIWQASIEDMVPEGTVVAEGEFVARLDASELRTKLKEVKIAMDKAQNELNETRLDTALTLSEARNNIINLRFDTDEKLAELEQSAFEAPATREKVRLAYERAKNAYDQEVENYQKRVAQAVAKVRSKELELMKNRNDYEEYQSILDEFVVHAPAAGMVIYDRDWDGKKRGVGSVVRMWNPIVATLPDLTEMESVTYVNEVDIQKIKTGQPVTITLDAIADKTLTGEITEVANIGEQRPNSDAKVFEVVISVNETDTTLRPAMTTSNLVLIAESPQTRYIPLESLHGRDSLRYVYVRTGGRPERREVRTGLINDNDVEIIEGVDDEPEIYLSLPTDTAGISIVRLSARAK